MLPVEDVGTREIYDQLVSLNSKLDVYITRHENLESLTKQRTEDHETRLRSLEKWRYGLPATLVLAVASIAVSIAAVFTRLG